MVPQGRNEGAISLTVLSLATEHVCYRMKMVAFVDSRLIEAATSEMSNINSQVFSLTIGAKELS